MEGRGDDEDDIKSMQLYNNIDRIWNELREEGFLFNNNNNNNKEQDEGYAGSREEQEGLVPVEVMRKFDCYDYSGGRDLVRVFAGLQLSERSVVLDVGAGIGGPARYLAHETGARVVGVELQQDVAALGNELTRRCSMRGEVVIVPGDFTDPSLQLTDDHCSASFHCAFSILVVLHIPKSCREALFRRCFELLRPGGSLYIEDFFRHEGKKFTDEEVVLLKNEVSIPDGGDLVTRQEYEDQVRSVGFEEVVFEDVSEEWTRFTCERRDSWRERKDRHVRVHNLATWESLDTFYSAIVTLFEGNTLGGVKLKVTKPSE